MVIEGRSILALLFDTDQAPFVVKNEKGGVPERWVPWREGHYGQKRDPQRVGPPVIASSHNARLRVTRCIGDALRNENSPERCRDSLELWSSMRRSTLPPSLVRGWFSRSIAAQQPLRY